MFTGRDAVELESIRMMQLQDEERDALSEERRMASGDAQDVSGLKPGTPPGRRLRAGTGWLAGHEG
ncbi:MAG TPA: hypothetical protein DHV72_11855 [Serratia grimesii]|uniref:Uncharacterized protein n=1 Tax=Serratia grimesii TaxID=82995 RepID=A0A9C7QY97_9GAMM|nr:hypothetical protein [Serratia grimesii]